MLTEIRARAQITIPAEILKKLNLKQGDNLEVDIEGGHIVLRPVIAVPKEQAYFWSSQWQDEEKQVQDDIKNNKINCAQTKDDLFKDLGL